MNQALIPYPPSVISLTLIAVVMFALAGCTTAATSVPYPAPATDLPSPTPATPSSSPLAPADIFQLASPTATPTATGTATRTSTPTRTPTPTQTNTFGPTSTLTAAPSLTPSRTPAGTLTPTPLQVQSGIFRPVFSLKNMPPGLVQAIFPLSGHRALITGTYGAVALNLLNEKVSQFRTSDRLLGVDADGRAWYSPASGDSVYNWDSQTKTTYAYRHGWILNAEFYDPPMGGSRLVDGRPGELWLVTAADMRRFDGERWRVFTATESGIRYTRQAYVHTAIALAVNPNTGQAVAGTCDWRGDHPLDGGPLMRYDGQHWVDAGFPLENPCVNWLTAAPDGMVYAAAGGSIWRLDGNLEWQELLLPALPEDLQYGMVEELVLDLEGNPWPLVQVTDLDGLPVERIRYRRLGSSWQAVSHLDQIEPQRLLFLPGRRVWALEQPGVYELSRSGEWLLQASLDYRAAGSDPEGGIWLVTNVEKNPIVWRGLP